MTDVLEKISAVTAGMEVVEPFVLADKLAREKIIPDDKKADVVAIVMATPTSMFIYNGARLLLEKILHAKSDIVLWTQGDPTLQSAKCETSGFLQLATKDTGTITTASAPDKISLLSGLLLGSTKNRYLFIDDKATQLFRTYQEVIRLAEIENKNVSENNAYIWVRQDKKTSDIYPTGFTDIQELSKFMQNKFTALSQIQNLPVYENSLYLIDFDRTLCDTDKWFQTVRERIAIEVARR